MTLAKEFEESYRGACKACGVNPYEKIIDIVRERLSNESAYSSESKGSDKESKLEGKSHSLSAQIEVEICGNSLDLFNSRFQNSDIQAFSSAVKSSGLLLESLDLRYNNLTAPSAQAIADLVLFGQLQRLVLTSNSLNDQALGPLVDALIGGKASLVELNLSFNEIGSAGGRLLAPYLGLPSSICSLQVLDLGNTEQDTDSLVALACALQKNTSLRVLNLDNPRVFSLNDEVTTHIANVIRHHPKLEDISLGKQRIRCSGAAILAEALYENERIRCLRLRGNQISIQGGQALAKLLLSPTCRLELLDLEANPIARGAEALSDALAYTESLQTLCLSNCSIVDESLAQLARGMAANGTVSRLTVWGNHFGPASSKLFYNLYNGRFKHCNVQLDIIPHVASMLPDASSYEKSHPDVQIAQA